MITVISYPNNNINLSIDEGTTLNSSELVKYLYIDVSEAGTDEYIEVTYKGDTITLLIQDECKYTPFDIFYQNKEGSLASFTMFKKSIESLSVTSEKYQATKGQPLNGFHQFSTFNVQGKQKLTLNTGFIDEENNEIIKQVLLSEKLWHFKDGVFIPLNIESKELEYKTVTNDKLINYTINFPYAFNEVNNI